MGLNFIARQLRQGNPGQVDEEIVALLDPGIEIEGRIKVPSGMIRLDCQFKGTICSAGMVVVASQAEVEGDIEAEKISISGKVTGNVHASKQLEIREHGILLGDIQTPSLKLESGAYFTGHCDMPTYGIENSARNEVASDREQA
ncbi:MAG TPA: polymer-forming cytoskeletal protein [Terriglobia bacterium]|nr:polymer-forming cytoskeletal protein [Terriglobia bacterium]